MLARHKIIVLSMYGSETHVVEALKHGAKDYLLKDDLPEELTHAIRMVASGQYYLSRPLTDRALGVYALLAKEKPEDPYDSLTDREREVLHLAAEGTANARIAEKLNISVRTTEAHSAHVMSKLGLSSQTDLIRFAIRRGIITA